jgi:MFS family permease
LSSGRASPSLFYAALVETIASPVTGRWADRNGADGVVRVGLLGAAIGLVLLALPGDWVVLGLVTVGLSGFIGMLWNPAGEVVATAADRLGLDHGWAFAASQVQWSAGAAIGAAAGGALGQAVGDWVPYVVAATICLVTAGFWWSARVSGPDPPLPGASYPRPDPFADVRAQNRLVWAAALSPAVVGRLIVAELRLRKRSARTWPGARRCCARTRLVRRRRSSAGAYDPRP